MRPIKIRAMVELGFGLSETIKVPWSVGADQGDKAESKPLIVFCIRTHFQSTLYRVCSHLSEFCMFRLLTLGET